MMTKSDVLWEIDVSSVSMNYDDEFEFLFRMLSSERFLKLDFVGNEVPFFIAPVDSSMQLQLGGDVVRLKQRLETAGIKARCLNIYDLCLDQLRNVGVLDELLKQESDFSKDELLDGLTSSLDPEATLKPLIEQWFDAEPAQVILVCGLGEVYPFVRTHTLLTNLHALSRRIPWVFFFPGNYSYSSAAGASLDLFGRFTNDKYYRAFNILEFKDQA